MTDKQKKEWVKKAMRVKSGKDITKILKRYWGVEKINAPQKDIVAQAREIFGN